MRRAVYVHCKRSALSARPVINRHLIVASRVTFAVISVRQELDSFPIDELIFRAPEIRRVDGSVQSVPFGHHKEFCKLAHKGLTGSHMGRSGTEAQVRS